MIKDNDVNGLLNYHTKIVAGESCTDELSVAVKRMKRLETLQNLIAEKEQLKGKLKEIHKLAINIVPFFDDDEMGEIIELSASELDKVKDNDRLKHEWVSSNNEVCTGGIICLKCGAIKENEGEVKDNE